MKEQEGRNGGKLKTREVGDPASPKAGRPKGSKNLSTLLKKLLKEKVSFEVKAVGETAGETLTMSKKKKMLWVTIQHAIDEQQDPNIQLKAATIIMDRLEGKAAQTVDMTTKGEAINQNPTIEIKYVDREEKAE